MATAASFNDKPKGDKTNEDELEDAEFDSDKGDGTATLMKPLIPTIHNRGHDTHHNIDGNRIGSGDALDEEFDDDGNSISEFNASKWHIVSAAIFVISSLLYLAMACMVMDNYWWYKDVPRNVYWADDDSTWWNYFVNCTDDAFMPVNVTNANDDYTWMEWYNYTAFPEDDIVWLPRIADENAPGYEPYVSKYMILYFWAAFGFLITGLIEIALQRKASLMIRVLYYLMMLAAIFGLVSAILTNKSPFWSNVANIISTNLWALEAIFIVLQRIQGTSDASDYDHSQFIFGWSIKKWFWVADISFLIGTWGDAITSWIYIFDFDNYILGILAIIFASMWQICAFVYLAVAIFDWKQFKTYFDLVEDYEQEIKEMSVHDGVVDKDGPANGGGTSAKDVTNPSSMNDDSSESGKMEDGDKAMAVAVTAVSVGDDAMPRATTNDLAGDDCCVIPTTI
jgi:hypothetical protein